MFARLVSAHVVTDKFDEGITIWKEQDMPLMESVKGYRGAYLLTDRKTGKVISMTLWDSEEDAIADEKSPLHQEQVDMYTGLLIGEPSAQYYEVSAKDKID
jgi:heme-degrading monooxygenase HmoA